MRTRVILLAVVMVRSRNMVGRLFRSRQLTHPSGFGRVARPRQLHSAKRQSSVVAVGVRRGERPTNAYLRGQELGFEDSRARSGQRGVPAFAEFLDHLFVERGNIVWLAARYEAVVDDDFLIDPFRTGVAHIGLDGRP